MVCFVSPHVKIRRAAEDSHAQARNLAERSTNASRIPLGVLFVLRVKLHFVVPRGTPNDSSVKYVYSSWFQILYRKAFSPSRTQCCMHMTFRTWGFRVILIRKADL